MEEVGELFSSVFESVCWHALPACVDGVRALSLSRSLALSLSICIYVCGCVGVCVRGRRVVKVERDEMRERSKTKRKAT